jgi:hypothetical protein
MGYIIKNNEGLIITRLTDVGRRKIAEGNFNIKYFQVGDSEVNYNTLLPAYNQSNSYILEPPFNGQNNAGVPQSTKNDVKYPYYLYGTSGITYGIPQNLTDIESVFNTATPLGFFSSNTIDECYNPYYSSDWVTNSFYKVNLSNFDGISQITLVNDPNCLYRVNGTIAAGEYAILWVQPDPNYPSSCGCFDSRYPVLFYKILNVNGTTITLDRPLPDLQNLDYPSGFAKLFIIPSGMTGYDVPTPINYWSEDVINYESICTPNTGFVDVWNMNIVWSENPIGLNSAIYKSFQNFASNGYMGTKEYLGYMSSNGQVFQSTSGNTIYTATTDTFYYNSAGEKIMIEPEEQQVISIIHYTNNSIINFYGEKFADEQYVSGAIGEGRNFKLSMPWIMWHKDESTNTKGLNLYIDPPGFDEYDLMTPHYIQSTKSPSMNTPGIRYYHLWDTNPTTDGIPNRVGKVFPDDKMIIIDDPELVAALSHASNRNFTIPAPKLSVVQADNSTGGGIIFPGGTLYVSYLFEGPWNVMNCNYISKISAPSVECFGSNVGFDVNVSFGNEFPFINTESGIGYSFSRFYVLFKEEGGSWRKIDFTQYLIDNEYYNSLNNSINVQGLVNLSFKITLDESEDNSLPYNLNEYLSLPTISNTNKMGFGDEYVFYGRLETDITATIYTMRYLINLPQNQLINTSNPSYSSGDKFMSEIGLYDENKNLLVLSKLQSPVKREGIQQIAVKLDF